MNIVTNFAYATAYTALALAISHNPLVAALVWMISFRLETISDYFSILVRSQRSLFLLQNRMLDMAEDERKEMLANHEAAVARVARNN